MHCSAAAYEWLQEQSGSQWESAVGAPRMDCMQWTTILVWRKVRGFADNVAEALGQYSQTQTSANLAVA